jgi:hypothetical protein
VARGAGIAVAEGDFGKTRDRKAGLLLKESNFLGVAERGMDMRAARAAAAAVGVVAAAVAAAVEVVGFAIEVATVAAVAAAACVAGNYCRWMGRIVDEGWIRKAKNLSLGNSKTQALICPWCALLKTEGANLEARERPWTMSESPLTRSSSGQRSTRKAKSATTMGLFLSRTAMLT